MDFCYNKHMIKEYLHTINCENIENAAEKFAVYCEFLKFWNENRCNLTSITNDEEIYLKHFIDSLAAVSLIPQKARVIDIGTGGGFPGVPLKIVRDDIDLTLVDSVNKKINFLSELTAKLKLNNVRCIHSRAEDLPKNEKYDAVVSRAVAALSTLAEYDLPFLKIGGVMIAYKSNEVDEEITAAAGALEILGGKIEKVIKMPLYSTEVVRSLVVIKKIKETPIKYPRGKNLPRVKPL